MSKSINNKKTIISQQPILCSECKKELAVCLKFEDGTYEGHINPCIKDGKIYKSKDSIIRGFEISDINIIVCDKCAEEKGCDIEEEDDDFEDENYNDENSRWLSENYHWLENEVD